ncbi:hypothetical protein WJX81_004478 [Elliptochloris bilobata]|uniref:Uncharacterized protein n=1 Tax=Elliptochloris bilobata TaxID=381761 RepID=A0AAW1QD72_9CHLO
MGSREGDVEKRLTMSLDDIIKAQKHDSSKGRNPAANQTQRSRGGMPGRGRGRGQGAAGGRATAVAAARANQNRSSALRQEKLAEKRGQPASSGPRPVAKAIPVPMRPAQRGISRGGGRSSGRGSGGRSAPSPNGRGFGGGSGAAERSVGSGGVRDAGVVMPTSMRITIFNELADRRPPVGPRDLEQQRLEQQWGAEALRLGAGAERAEYTGGRVDRGDFGGGRSERAGYGANGFAADRGGGLGGFGAGVLKGDRDLELEMDMDDAPAAYQDERRYGGAPAPVKAAARPTSAQRAPPAAAPMPVHAPPPVQARPPLPPPHSYVGNLRMDLEPPARTTRHGLLIR